MHYCVKKLSENHKEANKNINGKINLQRVDITEIKSL